MHWVGVYPVHRNILAQLTADSAVLLVFFVTALTWNVHVFGDVYALNGRSLSILRRRHVRDSHLFCGIRFEFEGV
eukprot:m.173306 g.173306  ORF g.173306 m.173306 type:complete len:75 (+) comp14584_c0_seq3:2718-2942(+)